MYKKGKKLCSTPVKVDPGSISLSLSDVKPSSSDTASLISGIRRKIFKRKNIDRKKKKCKGIVGKFKGFVRKIRRRISSESHTSDNEWEVQYSLDNNRVNQYEATLPLFESPERQRDLGIEKDYVLSPPLIGPRGRNLSSIEDGFVDNKEEEEEKDIYPLDDNKIEIDNSSPTFGRSKLVRTYAAMKKNKNWEERLLKNNGSGDWLIDVKMPTATAELLWKNYIEDRAVELPQDRINDVEKDDTRNERNDEDNNTDTLIILNEERSQLLKSNKLCTIKGGCSKTNGEFPVEIWQFVKVNGQWRRWITEGDKLTDNWSVDRVDPDLRDKNGTLISFNEFHARSKRKRNINTDCLPQRTSNVKIMSVVKFKAIVNKQPDGNFSIIKN